jgi:hypothetical protein
VWNGGRSGGILTEKENRCTAEGEERGKKWGHSDGERGHVQLKVRNGGRSEGIRTEKENRCTAEGEEGGEVGAF